MNCKTELENGETAECDLLADTAESSSCVSNPSTSATNVNREERCGNLQEKEGGLPGAGAYDQVPNEASSSELSIRSETLNGANGDAFPTTDSDCRGSPFGKTLGKTIRQKSRKRKPKTLIPGYTKDWESNDSWTSEKAQEDCNVAAEEIETKRKKIKSLQQKNRRLKVRHSRLKAAIKEMKATMGDRN